MMLPDQVHSPHAALPELNHRSVRIIVIAIGLIGTVVEGTASTISLGRFAAFVCVLTVGIGWLAGLRRGVACQGGRRGGGDRAS